MQTFWEWLGVDGPNLGLPEHLRCPPVGIGFGVYVAAKEALLLPDKPTRPGMTRINPFPATQRKLKRLFPIRSAPANSSSPAAPLSLTSPRPMAVPSPLQAAWDGFAGFF
jgi:hypothetical protein